MTTQFSKQIRESIKHWYLPFIIGIVMIGTGIWTFSSPLKSYLALSMVFSFSFLISGVLDISFAIVNRKRIDRWGRQLVMGSITAIIGAILISHPAISMTTLPLYVGFIVLLRSSGAIGTAIDLKNYGEPEWGVLMILGIFGMLFSLILIWNPIFTGITIVAWTAMAFFFSGVFNVYFSFKLRRLHKNWDEMPDGAENEFDEISKKLKDGKGKE